MKDILMSLLAASLLLTSCNMKTYQKSYLTIGPNIGHFTREKEFKARFLVGGATMQVQAAKAITGKFGVTADAMLGLTGQQAYELGFVYYKKQGRTYFETSVGLGYGHINSSVSNEPADPIALPSSSAYYYHRIQAEYTKISLQPSVFIPIFKNIDLGISLKGSFVQYPRYDYAYLLDDYRGSGYTGVIETDTISARNQSGFALEPVLTFKSNNKGLKFFMQMGGAFVGAFFKSNTLQPGYPPSYREYKSFDHPKFRRPLFRVGFEYRF